MGTRNSKTKLALIGSQGRLGSNIAELTEKEFASTTELATRIDKNSSEKDFKKALASVDVFLDVSLPTATESYLKTLIAEKSSKAYVIGCTGWKESQLKTVEQYAKKACVILAPNFSPGVNLLLNLVEQAAPAFKKLGYNAILHEVHHIHKLDAPSGTAKAILEKLGGMKTQVHSSRAGKIVGTHTLQFVSEGDIVTLSHEALDRGIFARGAILAASWAAKQKKPGIYSMQDVLFG